MAKDEKGHGSDSRGGSNYARQAPTKNGRARWYGTSMADRISVAQAQIDAREKGISPMKAHDHIAGEDATNRIMFGNREAAQSLSGGGPKSAPVPVHDSMMASAVRGGPGLAAHAAAEKIDYAHNPLGLSRSEVNADGIPNINRSMHGGGSVVDPTVAARFKSDRRAASGFRSGQREINRLRRQGK